MFKNFSNLQIPFFMLLFAAFLSVGCNNTFVPFGGKVTGSDGQPYTKGFVIFTNDKYSARGKLQPDGTYQLDSLKDGDGLEPGRYQVFMAGFHDIIDGPGGPIAVSDIAPKYESPNTSGLSCEVTRGGHYDFTIELRQKAK
jgi:hypothetical protein